MWLNLFLVSQSFHDFVHNAEITSGCTSLSGASMLKKRIKTQETRLLEVKTYLLKDIDYVDFINSDIKERIQQNKNFNPVVLWDFMKCRITGTTISYNFRKIKEQNKIKKRNC